MVTLNSLNVEINIILIKIVKHTKLLCKIFNLCLLGQLACYNDRATERTVEEA